MLQASAAWPSEPVLQSVPVTDANLPVEAASSVVMRKRELRGVAERLLAPGVQPEDWQKSFRVDEDGNLYGWTAESDRFDQGLVTLNPIEDSLSFRFAMRLRRRARSADAASLREALQDALAEKIAEAIAGPDVSLGVVPGVNGPHEVAATVILGPDRIGMLWDFLYVYESRDCLIGVFQSVPQRTAPADRK
jgi:hypothetical protein